MRTVVGTMPIFVTYLLVSLHFWPLQTQGNEGIAADDLISAVRSGALGRFVDVFVHR